MVTFMTYLTQFVMCYSICIFIFAPRLQREESRPEKKKLHKDVLNLFIVMWIFIITNIIIKFV